MKRKKMTWAMKVALDRKGYDPKKCWCVAEDKVAWQFATKTDGVHEFAGDGKGEIMTFWIEKG